MKSFRGLIFAVFLFLVFGFTLSLVKGVFPVSKIGTFGEWCGAIGSVGVVLYMMIQDRNHIANEAMLKEINEQESDKVRIESIRRQVSKIKSETIMNQKRVHFAGPYATTGEYMKVTTGAILYVDDFDDDYVPIEVVNMLHAIHLDYDHYNALVSRYNNIVRGFSSLSAALESKEGIAAQSEVVGSQNDLYGRIGIVLESIDFVLEEDIISAIDSANEILN